MLARGEWKSDDLIVAKSGDIVVGAVFAQLLPGAAAVIWPARTIDDDATLEDELTAHALQHVSCAKIVQTFLKPDELKRSGSLLRAGFRRVTQVFEMKRVGDWPSEEFHLPDLRLFPTFEANPDTLRDTLWRCHEHSLDCPEMHEQRTPDEVLEGYADSEARWWLAERRGDAVGVLILANRELTFVGVVPEHRGKQIGRALVAAACQNSPELSLIVDVRNTPAVQLYLSMGFVKSGVREVFLKFQNG
jgi:ribosomal protein S18 acetylase RimI-like enzyme